MRQAQEQQWIETNASPIPHMSFRVCGKTITFQAALIFRHRRLCFGRDIPTKGKALFLFLYPQLRGDFGATQCQGQGTSYRNSAVSEMASNCFHDRGEAATGPPWATQPQIVEFFRTVHCNPIAVIGSLHHDKRQQIVVHR
jgi:hypothetical protein